MTCEIAKRSVSYQGLGFRVAGNGISIVAQGSPAPNLHKFFVYGVPQGAAYANVVCCEVCVPRRTHTALELMLYAVC
jgi:hypothetical protein